MGQVRLLDLYLIADAVASAVLAKSRGTSKEAMQSKLPFAIYELLRSAYLAGDYADKLRISGLDIPKKLDLESDTWKKLEAQARKIGGVVNADQVVFERHYAALAVTSQKIKNMLPNQLPAVRETLPRLLDELGIHLHTEEREAIKQLATMYLR